MYIAVYWKKCDLSPYRDYYESIKDVPVVNAETSWQSTETNQNFILVLYEALWMGDT